MEQVKMTMLQFMQFMQNDNKGATFSGMTYFVNESRSRQDKTYPEFDGKRHKLQKLVTVNATLHSKYQAKVNRILAECGVEFEWTPNKMTGRYYPDFDKNRAICFKDDAEQTPENAYLVWVGERHSTPQTQYFHMGQPIEHKDARTTEFFTPSGLADNGKEAVKNSMFNHALKAASEAEQSGNLSLAEAIRANANRLADHEEFQKLEFMFRTVKLSNLRKVRVKGMEITIEG
jgi:hypothetical protein